MGGRFKMCSEVNEFDKIIKLHQDNNDDIFELSNLRSEKWRQEYIKMGKNPPNYLNRDRVQTVLKYLVIEDMQNKQWVVYNSETKKILIYYFGTCVLSILNECLSYSPDFPFHQKRYQEFLSHITEDDYKKTQEIVCDNIEHFKGLFDILSTYDSYKKNHTKLEVEEYYYNLWIYYRYCYHINHWSTIASFRKIADGELDEFKNKVDDINKFIESRYEECKELEYDFHNLITKEFFIYHDFMVCPISEVLTVSGNAYVASDIRDIFSLDLLHILKGDTKTPHKCPRCGQLYFSNNNKSKYCDECRANSKIIRQENRKNNPCRYLHKQITDLLNNYTESGSETFRIESNYYWAIIQGNVPNKIPVSYDSSINTEKKYFEWLQKQKNKAKQNPPAT